MENMFDKWKDKLATLKNKRADFVDRFTDDENRAIDNHIRQVAEACRDFKQLNLAVVSSRRELFLGFQKTMEFDMYEAGEIEFENAFDSYLAQI